MRRRPSGHTLLIAGVVALAGCGSDGGDTDEPIRQSSSSPPSPSASGSTNPGEGKPDPDGRIVFGRITRVDDLYGQVVSLWAVDPDGSDVVQLTKGESAYPEWSPKGDRIAYTVGLPDGSWQVATMAPDGSDVKVLTSGPGVHETPSWTPDGLALVYGYNRSADITVSNTTLWRMNADGSGQMRIGRPDTFDVEPRVSPDGRSVVFMRAAFEGKKVSAITLVVRDLTTGRERPLPAAGSAAEHPEWSPDGSFVAYNVWSSLSDTVPSDQVEKVPADGSGARTVLFPASATKAGFKPRFSPDGSRLVIGCKGVVTGKDDAACTMDADGSNVKILVDSPSWDENHFDWGPVQP